MKLQSGLRWLCAAVFAAGALFVFAGSTGAQTQPAAQSLDGLWLTDGYGMLIEIQGDALHAFEITKLSCIAALNATRQPGGGDKEVVLGGDGERFRISSGSSQETRWLHIDGSVSSILLRRTSSKPEPCGKPLADTPVTNYQLFWETFSENYPFFALHKVDWHAVDKKFRPQVTQETKPEELLRILSDMIDPLHDAHTFINAKSIKSGFGGRRLGTERIKKEDKDRIKEIIETKYVSGGLRDFCNGQLQFGWLRSPRGTTTPDSQQNGGAGGIGYLRIHSFNSYSKDAEFVKQLDALEAALDEIFKDSSKPAGLVIDLRTSNGGSDVFGVSIASRLATQEYLAYDKVTRNDIRDADHRTAPQPVTVHVSPRPGFKGPVVLLTSAQSVSAAETFTMALLDRTPHVVRIGANTQGVFSDVLVRRLPNGWIFGLPNEIYLTKNGKAYDGTGVSPDIEVPVFPKEDLANGRDSGLEKAMEVLGRNDH